MTSLTDLDALDLSARMQSGDIRAEDLMRDTLERIASTNDKVNAIVSLRDEDTLIKEARAADAAPRKGWMHGLPLAVKDLANAEGLPTSMGSPAMPREPALRDDIVVARMRAAGAIIIGKSNTPEFGLGSHSYNPVFGATCNPYDLTRSAGGSSGGAGAALAARMVALADGSDMMGSLRNPAAWNNVYGFRPTWGRVPNDPEGDLFLHPLATLGPMARSVSDLAALLDTQSGWHPAAPLSHESTPVLPRINERAGRMRIGWLGDWGGAYAMEPSLLRACEDALAGFAEIDCDVEVAEAPFPADAIWDAWVTLRAFAVSAKLGPLYDLRPADLKPEAIWEVETGRALSAMQVQRASALRSDWFRAVQALFGRYDAMLLPATQLWPFPVEWTWPREINGRGMDSYHRWMEVVIPVSLLGLPSLALPAGFGATNLPFGLQLFGPHGSDVRLLQIGHHWHQTFNWPKSRPPRV